MSKHGQNWWYGVILISVIVLFPMIVTSWYSILNPAKAYTARKQALNSDHDIILAACREMLTNRDRYRNDWEGNKSLSEGDKVIDALKGITPDVPKPIRELKPKLIILRKDKVEIHLPGPYSQSIQGFKEGVPGNGKKMLTNGLWYVSS